MINTHIIGVAKCGTTTLAEYLGRHSEIKIAKGKEVHFFDVNECVDRGYDYYHKIFGPKLKVNIDATPAYIRREIYLKRLHDYYHFHNLTPRIIILVRNPVDRAISHYLHRYRTGHESAAFFKIIKDQMKNGFHDHDEWDQYVGDGEYSRIFTIVQKYFSNENVLVLRDIDLKQAPHETLRKVQAFLQVDDQTKDILEAGNSEKNVTSSPRSLFLSRLLARNGIGKEIIKKILGRDKSRRLRFLLSRLNTVNQPLEFSNNLRNSDDLLELQKYYEKDRDYLLDNFGIEV
ncbi:sulfotransferase domain-containing protein [Salibaculum griseiflavum]|uniref:Sulfotransferase domain-containing protein n=1 Tax=Salibaculum griseiflavum TaxID=1914409 RepID=A0A2V1P411_9RHOB|nr:sulfotransferase domain-containing protein [Salibaculum griseiflavum]PWG16157.1 hypothetical protein DFK10_13270 [Salibaculum griseiflavum]